MKEYIKAFKEYATFKGRATRREYWMFFLVNMIIAVVMGFCIGFFRLPPVLVNIYQLVILIPSIALAARRLHDIDHSGWWMLLPLYNLYLFCVPSDAGANRFGPPPAKTAA